MNIDDLRRDIEEYEDEGEQILADELSSLAYAWENEEDINEAVAHFINEYPDYQVPNFIDYDYEVVTKLVKEKQNEM